MGFSVTARAQYTPRSGSTGQFIAVRVVPGVTNSVGAAQGLVVQEAKSNVRVDTGELRDSIHAETPENTGKTVVGNVVASAGHAAFNEFGTGRAGAQGPNRGNVPYSESWPGWEGHAFIRPALDTTREAVNGVFRSEIALSLGK